MTANDYITANLLRRDIEYFEKILNRDFKVIIGDKEVFLFSKTETREKLEVLCKEEITRLEKEFSSL